jgi:hypothetical protein
MLENDVDVLKSRVVVLEKMETNVNAIQMIVMIDF